MAEFIIKRRVCFVKGYSEKSADLEAAGDRRIEERSGTGKERGSGKREERKGTASGKRFSAAAGQRKRQKGSPVQSWAVEKDIGEEKKEEKTEKQSEEGGKTRHPWPAAAFFEKKCLPKHTMEGIVLRKNQSAPKGHPAATETQKRTCIKLHIAPIWELADSYILLYSKKKYKNNKRRKIIKKDKEYRAGKRITLHKKRQK